MPRSDKHLVQLECAAGVARVALNDPTSRNALSLAMFDALDNVISQVHERDDARVMLMRGNGGTFCAGFDLKSAAADPALMGRFIHRLSRVNRSLRRLPCVVIAAVEGAAIAGGCAMLSACDMVITSPHAMLGYPVHRIGVSPAVTIPTLSQALGPGATRTLLMSGELINGIRAHEIGLATHLASSVESLAEQSQALATHIAAKPPHALRITKAWLNELDGSLDDTSFDATAEGSAALADTDEAVRMLRAFWEARSGKP